MQVKYTTSSCGTLSTWNGNIQSVPTSSYRSSTVYSFTYSRMGGWPCLTFKVQFWEDDGASDQAASTQQEYTASGTHQMTEQPLTIGTANGHFDIKYYRYTSGIFK